MKHPLRLFLLVPALAALAIQPGVPLSGEDKPGRILTICLLPLAPDSPEAQTRADAVTSAIRTHLSSLPWIRLLSMEEVMAVLPELASPAGYTMRAHRALFRAHRMDLVISGKILPPMGTTDAASLFLVIGPTGKVMENLQLYGTIAQSLADRLSRFNAAMGKEPDRTPATRELAAWNARLGRLVREGGFAYPEAAERGTVLAVEKETPSYPYHLHTPPEWSTRGYRYPLLVFLHGFPGDQPPFDAAYAGGSPLGSLVRWDSGAATIDQEACVNLPPHLKGSFVLLPMTQTPGDGWNTMKLNALVMDTVERYPVDLSRIYVMGASMGGSGAWNYAAAIHSKVAAVAPLCGGSDVSSAVTALLSVPVWAFHAFDDEVLPVWNTTNAVVERILPGVLVPGDRDIFQDYPNENGNRNLPASGDCTIRFIKGALSPWEPGVLPPERGLAYTVFKTGGHAIAARVYADPEFWKWMYAQSR